MRRIQDRKAMQKRYSPQQGRQDNIIITVDGVDVPLPHLAPSSQGIGWECCGVCGCAGAGFAVR